MQLLENRYFMVFVVLALVLFSGMTAAQDYGEAPMLTEMVEAGELPQVGERLPVEPLVVEGYDGIGQYGGTIRTTTTAPEGIGDDYLLMPFYAGLVQPHPETHELYPHLARDIEVSEDATTFTFHLREGLRWSDGEPYTADDIMFWYEDMLLNEDLTPVVGHQFRRDGETVEVTKVDDYTVEFKFAAPHPFFLNYLVHGNFHVRPKHYLTQFHIDYVSEEELLEAAREEGYELWYDYFWAKADVVFGMPVALDLPTVGPYMIVGKTAERRQFERNPYFWKVDTEGNQLPYIDRIDTQIVSDLEVIQGMIMSGAVDFVGYGTDLRNYPMYRSYEDEGGYRTLLWESGMGSEVILMVNQTHEDLALRELFQDKRVRQAISQAIDRDEINEVVYFGQGVPRQYTVLDTSQYYEPEFETAFIEYDPERANELLDEAGLDEYDSEGFRLRPDGERFMFTVEYYDYETPKAPVVELIIQHLQEVGIDARSRSISGELMGERAPANMLDANVWHGDKATDILFPTNAQFFIPMPPGWERTIWPLWGTWFQTDGAEGEEPPEHIKELYGWWDDMLGEPDEERRIELGKKIVQAQAENLWAIGTVGEAPKPLIVNEDLRNFPEEGFWVWDTIFTGSHYPSTYWLDR